MKKITNIADNGNEVAISIHSEMQYSNPDGSTATVIKDYIVRCEVLYRNSNDVIIYDNHNCTLLVYTPSTGSFKLLRKYVTIRNQGV